MLLSCEPLHSWDRERSNTHAKSPRFVRKGFRHPFFLHSAASAITSPPHKAYSLGVFLIKGPRFWSRARSRLLAKATHVSDGKICPEFAPQSRRLLRCRFDVGPDPRELLHLRPQAGDRAGVEHRLTARPIPPERATPVLVLEGPYRLQGSDVGLGEFATDALQVFYVAIGAYVHIVRVDVASSAVAVAIPLAGVLLLGKAESLRLARHNARFPNDVHVSPLDGALATHARLYGAVLLPQHAFPTLAVVAGDRIDVAPFLQQPQLREGRQMQPLQIPRPSPTQQLGSGFTVEGPACLKEAERVLL